MMRFINKLNKNYPIGFSTRKKRIPVSPGLSENEGRAYESINITLKPKNFHGFV